MQIGSFVYREFITAGNSDDLKLLLRSQLSQTLSTRHHNWDRVSETVMARLRNPPWECRARLMDGQLELSGLTQMGNRYKQYVIKYLVQRLVRGHYPPFPGYLEAALWQWAL